MVKMRPEQDITLEDRYIERVAMNRLLDQVLKTMEKMREEKERIDAEGER